MATVKLKGPSGLTGNNEIDINMMHGHLRYLTNQLNYILNNLDDENIISKDERKESED